MLAASSMCGFVFWLPSHSRSRFGRSTLQCTINNLGNRSEGRDVHTLRLHVFKNLGPQWERRVCVHINSTGSSFCKFAQLILPSMRSSAKAFPVPGALHI